MKDQEDMKNGSLEKALEGTNVATNVGLVLFAALIASFLGLWNQIGPFKKALTAQQRYERRQGEADAESKARIAQETRGILTFQSLAHTDEHANVLLKLLVVQKADQQVDLRDPFEVLTELQKTKNPLSLVLARDIDEAISNLRRQNSSSLQRFHMERATAESTPFKLLGLEFSVDGFWAWDVWGLFWCGGVLYLWLMRRGFLIRARQSLADSVDLDVEGLAEQATVAVWIRPLSPNQQIALRTGELSLDIVMDPLSALCALLMWACSAIAYTAVIRMSVVVMGLMIGTDNHILAATLHAAICCLTTAVGTAAIFDWYTPEFQRAKKTTKPLGPVDSSVLVSRRAWIVGLSSFLGTLCLYWSPAKRRLVHTLLDEPRFNRPSNLRGPRKRRSSVVKINLPPGFYLHRNQAIYHVPPGGRCRALARTGDSELVKWEGPFDADALVRVHASAMIPFVREAVRSKIPSRRKRNDSKLLATLLTDAKVLERVS